jgi:serine/threonine-protein kinase
VNRYLLGGRYRLADRIASGGMGEVWRGRDELLGRPVAVKLLSAARAGNEAFRARFRAEARYAASLSHPGIAQVYDYGETGGEPHGGAYLVMELVTGEALSAALAREGRLSPGAMLDIVGQAARALQVAHSAGIVHRDIKPGNLLVTTEGLVKITDFGIARALRAAQTGHLTQTGMVMGTARYVSPEQASGLDVGAGSDIYSLGVVAYECLAGQAPFAAEAPIAVALAHVHAAVPPLPADIPGPVADLVMAMLAKRPEDRPGSARLISDHAFALRDALPAPDHPTNPGADDPHGTAWLTPGAPTRETVLTRGGGPVSPFIFTSPQPGISGAGDPPGLARTGLLEGAGFAEPYEWTGPMRPRRFRRARRTVFFTATLGAALAGIGIAAAVLMMNGQHGPANGKTSRPGTQANRTSAGPPGSSAAGAPARLIDGRAGHGHAAHAGDRHPAREAKSGTRWPAGQPDSSMRPRPTATGSPQPTVTASPTSTLTVTPSPSASSAQPSSTP